MDRAEIAVSQWARERPDLRTLPMAVFGRLNEAAERVMREHMNPLFAQAGLQSGEFDVLATLRRSGAPYTLSPTQLYEAAMISSGGMTDRIDRLERAGLVLRRPDPKDRRGKLIVLTDPGKRLIDEAKRLLLSLTLPAQESLGAPLKKRIAAL